MGSEQTPVVTDDAIREYIQRLRNALAPFAAMHRPDSDPKEVACQRGVASDATYIFSGDFQRASEALSTAAQPTPPAPAPQPVALPDSVLSVTERAMEWKGPLWDAINAMRPRATDAERLALVVRVERAVETAMRLAVECAAHPPAPSSDAARDAARLTAARNVVMCFADWPEHDSITAVEERVRSLDELAAAIDAARQGEEARP